VPRGWTRQPPPANGDGFTVVRTRARLTYFGSNNVMGHSVRQSFVETVRGLRSTGWRLAGTSVDRSGYIIWARNTAGQTTYRRTLVGRGSTNTIMWTFPTTARATLAPMIRTADRGFRPGALRIAH